MSSRRNAWTFSSSLSSLNEALPTGACTFAPLSTRNSILPALSSFTALVTSNVTVPDLGFGIRPRGPSTRPSLPTSPIMSGVATIASMSSQPSWIFFTNSSAPAWSAPAASASRAFSPFARTSTRRLLPVPCGSTTVPRTSWSECRGSTPRCDEMTIVSSNFARAVCFTSLTAPARSLSAPALLASSNAARYRLPCFPMHPPVVRAWRGSPATPTLVFCSLAGA